MHTFRTYGRKTGSERAPGRTFRTHGWKASDPGVRDRPIESATMGAKQPVQGRSVERLKFFSDAVVAIAMTLLVLPLLESVPEAAANDESASEWLGENIGQLVG